MPQDGSSDALAACLLAGERILWTGKPDPAVSMASRWLAVPIAIFWVSFSGSGVASASARGETLGMWFGLVFVAIGVLILASPFHEFLQARRTAYAITTRRLLIARGNGASVKSVLLSGVRQVERIEKRNSITLRIPTAMVADGDGVGRADYLELHGLRDGERAYRLLVDH